jgi:ribosomal protein S18 acetylase RimI-like enzyme
LAWDSEFFDVPTALVRLDADGGTDLPTALGADCDMAYLLCDASRVDAINEAESHGFRLVDLRCLVELTDARMKPPAHGISLREASESEIGAVADMAAVLHDNTRFANDGAIPRAKVAELYRRYVVRDAASSGWSVCVAVRDRNVVGYATHGPRDRDCGGDVGTIGLIGVAPTARGLGLGVALVAEVVRREAAAGRSRMSVVTQGGSRPALAMYQRAGFVVARIDAWLHWHRDCSGT